MTNTEKELREEFHRDFPDLKWSTTGGTGDIADWWLTKLSPLKDQPLEKGMAGFYQVGEMIACGHCESDKYSAVEPCPCKCHKSPTKKKEKESWEVRFDEQMVKILKKAQDKDLAGLNEMIATLKNQVLEDYKAGLLGKIDGEICEVPEDPLPRNIKDLETFTVERIDQCLKYAGRFNYNKALQDIKTIISEKEV